MFEIVKFKGTNHVPNDRHPARQTLAAPLCGPASSAAQKASAMSNTERTYTYIRQYLDAHERGPSLAQIGHAVGIAIPTVHHHLVKLEDQGRIVRSRRWYDIRLAGEGGQ